MSYSLVSIAIFLKYTLIISLIGFIIFWLRIKKMTVKSFYEYFRICFILMGCFIFGKIGIDLGAEIIKSQQYIGLILSAGLIIMALIVAKNTVKKLIKISKKDD